MPTIDDLHAAFAELEDRAPRVGNAPVPLVRDVPRRSHRTATLLSAAAVVALGAGAAVAFSGSSGPDSSGIAPGSSLSALSPSPADSAEAAADAKAAARAAAKAARDAKTRASSAPGTNRPSALPLSTRVPFSISGLADLTVNPDLTVTTGGVTWAFGWGMQTLDPGTKPSTEKVRFGGRDWIVQHDPVGGAIWSLWVTEPGFGMTITPVGEALTLDQYKAFLGHVSFPKDLTDPGTWPTAADLK